MFQDSLVNIRLIQAQIKQATGGSLFPSEIKPIKKNLSELLASLHNKNLAYSDARNITLDRVNVQMEKRGVNTRAIDKIAIDALEKSKKTRLLKKSIFEDRLVDDMTVEEYIEKRSEESRLNLVYQLMSEKKSLNDMFKDRIAKRLQSQPRAQIIKDADTDKKEIYAKIMKKYVQLKNQMTAIDLIREFKQSGVSPIWNILQEQLRGCEPYIKDSERLRNKILQNSLQILEQRFSMRMPMDDRHFSRRCLELSQIDNKNAYMKHERPYWAICYYLLRSGRIKKLGEVLSEVNELEVAQIADNINNMLFYQQKNLYSPRSAYSDIYLEQMRNILLKRPVADPIFVQNIEDFIWLALKTSSSGEFSLSELHEYIMNRYSEQPNNLEMLDAIALSLNFSALLNIQNVNLTTLENTHLSIIYEILGLDASDLADKRNKQVADYLTGDILAAFAYLPLQDINKSIQLLIKSNRIEEFVNILCDPVSRQALSNIYRNQQHFLSFVKQFSLHLLKTKQNYVNAARITMEVIGDVSGVIEIIIQCQLESLINSSFSTQELSRTMEIIKSCVKKRPLTQKQSNLLNFVKQYRLLENCSKNKDSHKIAQVRDHSFFFPVQPLNLTEECQNVLAQLKKYGYIDVIINYINLVIYLNDILFSYKNSQIGVYKQSLGFILFYVNEIESYLRDLGMESFFEKKFKEILKEIEVRLKN